MKVLLVIFYLSVVLCVAQAQQSVIGYYTVGTGRISIYQPVEFIPGTATIRTQTSNTAVGIAAQTAAAGTVAAIYAYGVAPCQFSAVPTLGNIAVVSNGQCVDSGQTGKNLILNTQTAIGKAIAQSTVCSTSSTAASAGGGGTTTSGGAGGTVGSGGYNIQYGGVGTNGAGSSSAIAATPVVSVSGGAGGGGGGGLTVANALTTTSSGNSHNNNYTPTVAGGTAGAASTGGNGNSGPLMVAVEPGLRALAPAAMAQMEW